MWTTPTLLHSCSFHAPALLLPYSSPAPASAQPLPYSCPASFKLLSSTFLAPPQFLPSSPLSALLCFTLLSSAPALFLLSSCRAPTLLLLLLCSCFPLACFYHAPEQLLVLPTPVWQLSSSSAPYNFLSSWREPPFMAVKSLLPRKKVLLHFRYALPCYHD